MFKFVLTTALYSYLVFFAGLLGLINFQLIAFLTIIYFLILLSLKKGISINLNLSRLGTFFLILIFILALINLLGALGPELSFDALWYHLTIPKEFISNGRIFYIPGNLLYYSAMPMFVHMLYVPGLLLGGEILPKLTHFLFGILILIVIYKFARVYLNKTYSLLAALIFYSNLVVGWLSITAFVDLPRAFFEIYSLYLFILFNRTGRNKYLYQSAFVLGLAISTKILSLPTLLFYILALTFLKKRNERVNQIIAFTGIVMVVIMPWLTFSYINTGNPIFPVFSQYYSPNLSSSILSPIVFIKSCIDIFLFSQDPLSPVYLIVLPLFLINFKKISTKYFLVTLYTIITFVIWYVTPHTGGGRFITAYLPAYSILCAILIYNSKKLRSILIGVVLIISVVSIIYRGVANYKFLPVIFQRESKEVFLMDNLNFEFGDFYDEDSKVKNIVGNNKVLLIGLHNLYYVDFPHDHLSWAKRYKYRYLLVQSSENQKYYFNYSPIYSNEKTNVTLYKLND